MLCTVSLGTTGTALATYKSESLPIRERSKCCFPTSCTSALSTRLPWKTCWNSSSGYFWIEITTVCFACFLVWMSFATCVLLNTWDVCWESRRDRTVTTEKAPINVSSMWISESCDNHGHRNGTQENRQCTLWRNLQHCLAKSYTLYALRCMFGPGGVW